MSIFIFHTPRGFTFLNRQIITSTGTYTPTVGGRACLLQEVAGGGGGGGAGGGGNRSCGSGGGSGLYGAKWINPGALLTGGTATIGAAGSAGASTGGDGGTGGDTSVVINGTTYTVKGGTGGKGSASGTVAAPIPGKVITFGASSFDAIAGENGQQGFMYDTSTIQWGGSGGGNPLGVGGAGTPALGAGATGQGNGAGGAGANSTVSGNAGGAGTLGLIIIDEYILAA